MSRAATTGWIPARDVEIGDVVVDQFVLGARLRVVDVAHLRSDAGRAEVHLRLEDVATGLDAGEQRLAPATGVRLELDERCSDLEVRVGRELSRLDEAHVVAKATGIGSQYEVVVVPAEDVFVVRAAGGRVLSIHEGSRSEGLEAALAALTALVVAEVRAEVG